MNTTFSYQDGRSVCTIEYKGICFIGDAKCHEQDNDFKSEKTGLQIAEIRANIKLLQFRRDTEIKPQIKILKHLLHNIQSSKYHNPKAYESIMIRKQLKALQADLNEINGIINDEKKYLKDYIDKKDDFYNKIRAKREND